MNVDQTKARLSRRGLLMGATAALLPRPLWAQGFAGLGADADGFAVPAPDYAFAFPQDAGPHPDFRIEWWYVTANLTGADGRDYGVQWTLFRNALAAGEAAGWDSPQVWLGHFGLTTPDHHYSAERYGRGGIGQAGATAAPFAAWIDDWEMTGTGTGYQITARTAKAGYDLTLTTTGPRVFHGDAGYSVKSAQGQASYYYSDPFLQVSGTLDLPEGPMKVTGEAWLDREWSSQPLAEDQTGWDWFSLSFDTGDKLMGFRLRDRAGGAFTSATWIAANGDTTAYPDGAFQAEPLGESPAEGRTVPTLWQVRLPDRGVDVTVDAVNPGAWMDITIPYWEGPVRIEGSHTGRGYLEMTGY